MSWGVCIWKTEPRGKILRWRRQNQKQEMEVGGNRGDRVRNRGDDEGQRQRRWREREEGKIEWEMFCDAGG